MSRPIVYTCPKCGFTRTREVCHACAVFASRTA
jgi:hypothetical protein